MTDLQHTAEDLQRVLESIDLTYDRSASEGYEGADDGMEMLKEFCDVLIRGRDLDTFLSGQDMVIPGA